MRAAQDGAQIAIAAKTSDPNPKLPGTIHTAAAEIEAAGFRREYVDQVVRLIRINEYKRRQAPPILKVSTRAFGPGRVVPITCRF